MSQNLLRKWLLVGDNGKPVKVSQSQFSKLVVFANWLESDAELQRAADRSAIELLAVIRNAGEVEMDDFSEEFWQEVDAVLKTAGGD